MTSFSEMIAGVYTAGVIKGRLVGYRKTCFYLWLLAFLMSKRLRIVYISLCYRQFNTLLSNTNVNSMGYAYIESNSMGLILPQGILL